MKSPTQRQWFLLPFLLIGLAAHAGSDSVRNLPNWGQVNDPDGDCTIASTNEQLTISVPGTTHDLSSYHSIYKKRNAPRVLQEAAGDFTVQVKVSATFEPGKAGTLPEADPFNGAGLLLWDNDENFLRFECNVWITPRGERFSYLPLFEYWKKDKNMMTNTPSARSFSPRQPVYLRLTRQGNRISTTFSNDGVNWMQTNSVTVQFPQKIKVGVDAINTSKQPFTVEFGEFKLVSAHK